MIFHSRISENKVQSFITIPFYERMYCMAVGWVAILLHWLVLGREDAEFRTASIIERIISTTKRKPAQAASTFGSYRSGLRPIGSCRTTQTTY